MKPRAKILPLVASIAAATLISTHAADIIAYDDFTTNNTDREVGDPLNGTTTPIGGYTWSANAANIFQSGGGVTVNSTSTNGAYINFTNLGVLDSITLTANIKPSGSDWGLVSFGIDALDASAMWGNNQLGVILTGAGGGQVFYDGFTKNPTNFSGVTFDEDGYAAMSLIYCYTNNSLSVSINNTLLLDTYSLGGFTPNIQTAGVVFQPTITANTPAIGGFEVSVVVPEPGSWVALALTAAGMVGFMLRRRRVVH